MDAVVSEALTVRSDCCMADFMLIAGRRPPIEGGCAGESDVNLLAQPLNSAMPVLYNGLAVSQLEC